MNKEWQMMVAYMDRLRGRLDESRRWNVVQTIIIAMLAAALSYTLVCGAC